MPAEIVVAVRIALSCPGLDSVHAGCRATRTPREPHRRANDPQTKQPVGGLTGRTSLGLLFIDLFSLPDNMRGGGLGSRRLRLAEDEARLRGCVGAVLYTINLEAPGFYERHGYRILGTVPCLPPGTSRIFMTKPLT